MPRDRNDYRSLGTPLLLRLAREEGMNEEMAVAITERLAERSYAAHTVGCYHFNTNQTGDQ